MLRTTARPLGEELELVLEFSKPRHSLSGQPVLPGTRLEVYLGGKWHPGRYEWSFNPDMAPIMDLGSETIIDLDPGTPLRWRSW